MLKRMLHYAKADATLCYSGCYTMLTRMLQFAKADATVC